MALFHFLFSNKDHEQRRLAFAIALLSGIALFFVVRLASTLWLPAVYDYDEGWNAYQALTALAMHNPYPPEHSFWYNNYPPLSYYIVGSFGRLLGDNIVAGRIISLLAFLISVAALAMALRRMGAGSLASGFGALVYAVLLLADYHYVGMNDPQQLGHAFQLCGLVVLLRSRGTGPLLAAAFLLAAGFFVKHVLITLPIVATLWLLWTDRPAGARLAAYGVAIGLAGMGIFQLVFGVSLWSQINSPRLYSVSDTVSEAIGWLEVGLIPVLAALAFGFYFRRDPYARLVLLYLGLALPLGIYFTGGAGTSGNVLFDALIALGLAAGLGAQAWKTARPGRGLSLHMACFLIPILLLLAYRGIVADNFSPRYWLTRGDAQHVKDVARDIAFLRAYQGPVLCAELSICYWAGKPAEVDVGMIGQAIATGRRDGRDLKEAFREGHYDVVMLATDPETVFPAHPEFGQVIRARYQLHHVDTRGQFWIRRSE